VNALRLALLTTARALGVFGLCRRLTRSPLRILCYHGFSSADEHLFRPQLFIRPDTFRARMAFLKSARYPVLDLGEALDKLRAGTLPPNAVAITIDDGFRNVLALAAGILAESSFPSTVYVTTYYMERNHPIFRLALQYLFWKSGRAEADLEAAGLAPEAQALGKSRANCWELIEHCESAGSEDRRQEILRALGRQFGVDMQELATSSRLTLMDAREVAQLARFGMDVQLHTHRHRLPLDPEGLKREINENRRALEGFRPLTHFCYPSGIWARSQWPHLEALEVRSATTCEPGFNYPDTPPLGLRRFLDSEAIHPLEFEAELCGFLEIMRRVTGKSKRIAALSSSGGGNPSRS
jgi:peptidoglycan/xylan/chitin deacetylase (PgdA/CDA1 family)